MLQRVDGATIAHEYGRVTGRGYVTFTVGSRSVRIGDKIHRRDFEHAMDAQRTYPVFVTTVGSHSYWHFENRFFATTDELVAAEVYALLLNQSERSAR
jgi:hypothetical protein